MECKGIDGCDTLYERHWETGATDASVAPLCRRRTAHWSKTAARVPATLDAREGDMRRVGGGAERLDRRV